MQLSKYKELAKGFRTGGKNCKRIMVPRVDKSLEHAYVGRKLKKRGMDLFNISASSSFNIGY